MSPVTLVEAERDNTKVRNLHLRLRSSSLHLLFPLWRLVHFRSYCQTQSLLELPAGHPGAVFLGRCWIGAGSTVTGSTVELSAAPGQAGLWVVGAPQRFQHDVLFLLRPTSSVLNWLNAKPHFPGWPVYRVSAEAFRSQLAFMLAAQWISRHLCAVDPLVPCLPWSPLCLFFFWMMPWASWRNYLCWL